MIQKLTIFFRWIYSSRPRLLLTILFILGYIYISLPGASSIEDFPALPDSTRSDLDGDTWQNPNLVAYFSDYRREYITKYYRNFFDTTLLGFLPIPVISLNHRVEDAYKYVRDQQESTFLEEYVFPLHSSIFVNGYDPYVEDEIYKKPHNFVADHIHYKDRYYNSKTTLRYYPSSFFARLVVYIGIWILGVWLFKLSKRIFSRQSI